MVLERGMASRSSGHRVAFELNSRHLVRDYLSVLCLLQMHWSADGVSSQGHGTASPDLQFGRGWEASRLSLSWRAKKRPWCWHREPKMNCHCQTVCKCCKLSLTMIGSLVLSCVFCFKIFFYSCELKLPMVHSYRKYNQGSQKCSSKLFCLFQSFRGLKMRGVLCRDGVLYSEWRFH